MQDLPSVPVLFRSERSNDQALVMFWFFFSSSQGIKGQRTAMIDELNLRTLLRIDSFLIDSVSAAVTLFFQMHAPSIALLS